MTFRLSYFLGCLAPLLPFGTCHDNSSSQYAPFVPRGLALGPSPQSQTGPFAGFTLDPSSPIAVLDYGHEVAGVPWFKISNLDTPVQVEIKYSEEYRGLEAPFGDGPFLYGNQVGANFRIETLNLTVPGEHEAFLVQGGQRWQSIRLLDDDRNVTFSNVGFRATFPNVVPENEPGQFSSDNERLNSIWRLGVRAAEVSCIEEMTQPATWRVHPEDGVLIETLRPIQSDRASLIDNHTLEFETKIERGGLWWGVAWEIGSGGGIGLQLTGDLPESTTFLNHNYTLSPRNSLQVTSGWGQVNQTTLPTYLLETFDLPQPVHEKTWHKLRTTVDNGHLSVYVNGEQVFNISMAPYLVDVRGKMSPISLEGRFGFGAYQDQSAYYRNVVVYSPKDRILYENSLTSEDVLLEYGVSGNLFPACLDGPKRDRLIWLGDYYHTARIIGVSTSRHDLQKGTFQSLLPTQNDEGLFSVKAPLGYRANTTVFEGSYPLEDYQLLGLISLYYYVRDSSDLDFIKENWNQFVRLVSWVEGNINGKDGLVHLGSAFTGPADAGSSVSCMTVYALRSMAELATILGETDSAAHWSERADSLAETIRETLWNAEIGTWKLSASDPSNHSIAATAFCISGKVATPTQSTRSIQALEELALGPGYLDSTQINPADPTASISPNINGFLLSALFEAGDVQRGAELIDSLWGTMVDNDRTSSGASWEYVMHDGTPGLGLFTSLAHPWGGAATYVLTEWGAGLRAAEGTAGFGYKNWVIAPDTGIAMGLRSAQARVITAFGGAVEVKWQVLEESLHVNITAPLETAGEFVFGDTWKSLSGQDEYSFRVYIG